MWNRNFVVGLLIRKGCFSNVSLFWRGEFRGAQSPLQQSDGLLLGTQGWPEERGPWDGAHEFGFSMDIILLFAGAALRPSVKCPGSEQRPAVSITALQLPPGLWGRSGAGLKDAGAQDPLAPHAVRGLPHPPRFPPSDGSSGCESTPGTKEALPKLFTPFI